MSPFNGTATSNRKTGSNETISSSLRLFRDSRKLVFVLTILERRRDRVSQKHNTANEYVRIQIEAVPHDEVLLEHSPHRSITMDEGNPSANFVLILQVFIT